MVNEEQEYNKDDRKNWYSVNGIEDKTLFVKFFTVMYFMMTLLSAVGYGDLVPVNKYEMVFIVCE